jgi:hypothetical protein
LQGITSILGRRQVLFKMQRQGGKEESYVLNEGEREGDLEVLAIDEVAGSIKFNNQGTIQTLTMDKDASKPPAVAAPAAATAALPRPIPTVAAQGRPAGVPSPSPPPAAGGGSGVTAVGGQAAMRTIPTRTRRTGEEAGGSLAVASQPAEPAITPEEQTILMELDREANRDLIQKGEYPPPPPTELTPQGSYGMPELPPPPAE